MEHTNMVNTKTGNLQIKRNYKFKKMILVLITILLAVSMFIPSLIKNKIKTVSIAKVFQTSYSDDIFVSGIVEPVSKNDVIASMPIVPEEVCVKIGDKVSRNDVIAQVNVEATQNALFSMLDTASIIPKEYTEVFNKISITSEAAKGYIPTQINSPASGIVTSISLVTGAISMPKTTMVTISSEQNLLVKMTASEKDADKLAVGESVVFKASATENLIYKGKIKQVFPTAEKIFSGTNQNTVLNFHVELDQVYDRLKAGYSVSGIVKKPQKEKVDVVPYECILQDEKNALYIYAVKNNRVERINIFAGKEIDAGIEILSPNLIGKSIITTPENINVGDYIKINH